MENNRGSDLSTVRKLSRCFGEVAREVSYDMIPVVGEVRLYRTAVENWASPLAATCGTVVISISKYGLFSYGIYKLFGGEL